MRKPSKTMIFQPNINSLVFFVVSTLLCLFIYHVALPRISSVEKSHAKSIFLIIVSFIFLIAFLNIHAVSIVIITLASCLIYEVATRFKGRWTVIATSLIAVACLFLFSKLLKLFEISTGQYTIFIIGLSYMILKWVHFLMEHTNKAIAKITRTDFLSFLLFFPCFVAGPIMTFDEHKLQLSKESNFGAHLDSIREGVQRIVLGLVKIYFVGMYTSKFIFFAQSPEYLTTAPFWKVMFFIYMALIDLYFSFSGLIDTAIGAGLLFNYKAPENFNYPFLARNFQELWLKWHSTLSRWLRTYVFFPLYKFFNGKNTFKNRSMNIAMALFITFYCMSIFEGFNFYYSIHGLLIGIGAFSSVLWSEFIKSKGWTKKYLENRLIKYIAIFITFNYFSLCLLFFDANTPERINFLLKFLSIN